MYVLYKVSPDMFSRSPKRGWYVAKDVLKKETRKKP